MQGSAHEQEKLDARDDAVGGRGGGKKAPVAWTRLTVRDPQLCHLNNDIRADLHMAERVRRRGGGAVEWLLGRRLATWWRLRSVDNMQVDGSLHKPWD